MFRTPDLSAKVIAMQERLDNMRTSVRRVRHRQRQKLLCRCDENLFRSP